MKCSSLRPSKTLWRARVCDFENVVWRASKACRATGSCSRLRKARLSLMSALLLYRAAGCGSHILESSEN